MKGTPYWQLSSLYFFYFAVIGALIPYLGLYLQEKNFSAQEIGQLTAFLLITKIVSPALWGWLADHTGRHMYFVRLGSVCAFVFFTGFLFGESYAWLAAVILCFSFFFNAVMPQVEVTTLVYIAKQTHLYSKIRLWGSVSFVVMVLILGVYFEYYSVLFLPWFVIASLFALVICSFLTREHTTKIVEAESNLSLWESIKRPPVFALLIACLLLQASHGPYYTFYSIYLEEYDYSRNIIGIMWSVGVIAEIIAFAYMPRFLQRFNLRHLFMLSMALSALRWVMIAYCIESFVLLFLAQLLHAASFGLYHAVGIHFIHHYFPGKLKGRGQALYVSFSFGIGGALGSFLSGYTWELSASLSYIWASAACLLAFYLAMFKMENLYLPSEEKSTNT